MFEFLRGKVVYKNPEYIALDINGVGYKVYVSLRIYDHVKINEEVTLYTYNYIREDSYKIVGFLEEYDRKIFELLLGVKGIGVSLALAIVSTFDSATIRSLIVNEDYVNLKKVPKLGEKKAQQIILDLKSKFKNILVNTEEKSINFTIEEELYFALENLGYSKREIDKLIDKNELQSFKNIEEAIKFTLKKIRTGVV